MIKTFLWLSKPPGARIRHIKVILEANAVMSGNDDHGFIRETHAARQWRFVTSDKVRALVNLKTDTVPRRMWKARELVIRTEAMRL